jgi:hypothetical protein
VACQTIVVFRQPVNPKTLEAIGSEGIVETFSIETDLDVCREKESAKVHDRFGVERPPLRCLRQRSSGDTEKEHARY